LENETQGETGFSLRLGDLWSIIQMQIWLIVGFTAVVLVVAGYVTFTTTPVYQATASLRIGTVAGQEIGVEEVRNFELESTLDPDVFYRTQIEILQSRKIRTKVIEQYQAMGFDDLTVENGGPDSLGGMMLVGPRPNSEIVDISVNHTNWERAAVLANLITVVYEKENLESRRRQASEAQGWLENQLTEAEARIDAANLAKFEYQSRVDLADATEQLTALSSTMAALNTSFGELNTERVLLQSALASHEKLLARGEYAQIAQDLETPLLDRLAADYAIAVSDHAALAARYGERHPERMDAQARMERLARELESEVRRAVEDERARLRQIESKQASLQKEIDASKALLLTRQELVEGYDKLEQELLLAKGTYQQLQARNIELELSSRTQLNNVEIIDPAIPTENKVKPNITLNMMLALVTGVGVGVLIGFLREYFDDTIGSPLDVATYLRTPYLAMVPKVVGSDEKNLALYTHHNPTSAASEALRALRTVLELNPKGTVLKRLLVTSSVSSEGKTSTTVGLGVAFANLGKRVLLIDADLRRPRMHKVFDIPREAGVSGVLIDKMPLQSCLHPSLVPGLDVMPAGNGTDHPNELLASNDMLRLLEELDQRYDMVLIDTPPAVMLSDALILSKFVDGVVLVVREHTASRMLVKQTVGRLQQVGANLLGVVVNAVDMKARGVTYKYYYGYRYRYDQYYQEDRPSDRAAK
jgi:succinoglycan biosynthesis transport protein ExoP